MTKPIRDQIRLAVGSALTNNANWPPEYASYLLGRDMSLPIDKVTDAVLPLVEAPARSGALQLGDEDIIVHLQKKVDEARAVGILDWPVKGMSGHVLVILLEMIQSREATIAKVERVLKYYERHDRPRGVHRFTVAQDLRNALGKE